MNSDKRPLQAKHVFVSAKLAIFFNTIKYIAKMLTFAVIFQ